MDLKKTLTKENLFIFGIIRLILQLLNLLNFTEQDRHSISSNQNKAPGPPLRPFATQGRHPRTINCQLRNEA